MSAIDIPRHRAGYQIIAYIKWFFGIYSNFMCKEHGYKTDDRPTMMYHIEHYHGVSIRDSWEVVEQFHWDRVIGVKA